MVRCAARSLQRRRGNRARNVKTTTAVLPIILTRNFV